MRRAAPLFRPRVSRITTIGSGIPRRASALTSGFTSFAVRKVDARRLSTRLASHGVFDALSDRLQAALGDVRSRGKLTEDDINAAMRQVRLPLFAGDVNLKGVQRSPRRRTAR